MDEARGFLTGFDTQNWQWDLAGEAFPQKLPFRQMREKVFTHQTQRYSDEPAILGTQQE
jgi:hypothetical protein